MDDEFYEATEDIATDVENDEDEVDTDYDDTTYDYYDDEIYDDSIYDDDVYADESLYDYDYDYYDDDLYDYEYDYGYDELYEDDDWYYDYYDEGYAGYFDEGDDGLYDYSYRYYDYDNDGLYDAYTAFYDWDEDGLYEDSDYYAFNEAATGQQQQAQQQQAQQQQPQSARQQTVSGRIQAIKQVSVRDTQHIVVRIKRSEGKTVTADLGPVDELYLYDLGVGDPISVRGPVSSVGKAKVLVAQWMKANGETTEIERQRRSYGGQIASTKKVTVRGRQHLIAMVKTNRSGRKRVADLGPAKSLQLQLKQGDSVTMEAVPVKVQNQKMLLAQSVSHDGKTVQIDRRKTNSGQTQGNNSQRRRNNNQRQGNNQ